MSEPAAPSRIAVLRALALVVGALGAAALTWRLRPSGSGSDPVAEIVWGCAWLAWLVAGWLALSVAFCAATHLVGYWTRAAVPVDGYVPRRLSQLVDALVTAGLIGAVIGGTAIPAAATAAPTSATTTSHRSLHGDPLDWPGLADPGPPMHGHRRAPKVGPVSGSPRRDAAHDAVVTVRSGDSLWSIAANRLGRQATAAQIALEWPRWYAANRQVIGADPSLIRPGQRLRPPTQRDIDHTPDRPAGSSR